MIPIHPTLVVLFNLLTHKISKQVFIEEEKSNRKYSF